MNLVENITKLEHKTYGEGIYIKQCRDNAITVFFPQFGNKNFSLSAFDNGLLIIKEQRKMTHKKLENNFVEDSGATVQFDTSSIQIGERNILEASKTNDTLIFNESYTIIGDELRASKIYACYNLTVIGDIEVEEIQVNGSLSIIGNLKVMTLNCQNDFYCNGELSAHKAEIGKDLIAESIICTDLYCGGNVIVQTTIDIKNSQTEKVMVAGEGIIGGGNFSAQNAVAVEYFEYNGKIDGKVFELDTDSVFGNERKKEMLKETQLTFEELIKQAKENLVKEINDVGENSEDDLLEYAMKLSETDATNTADWFEVFSRIIEISYSDKIENFSDYLIILYAMNILPKGMTEYETVEHVFRLSMQQAREKGLELPIKFKTTEEFILCIKIVLIYYEQIGFDKEELLDKLFQAVGIKFNTVKSFFIK